MTPTLELTEVLKNAPTVSSLSGLLTLFVDSSGEPQKANPHNLIIFLIGLLCNSAPSVTNIDETLTAGWYQMSGVTQGTFPNIPVSNYGHLLVLHRDGVIQQIYFGRNGIAFRLKTRSEALEPWKTLIAT